MNVLLIFLLFFFIYMLAKLALNEAIYIPLPLSTIRKMLKLAKVRKNDLLYDLGAGDGRVVITAAKEFGCKAVGIERSALLAAICRWRVKREGLQGRVKILEKDYFDVDLIVVLRCRPDVLLKRLKKRYKGNRKKIKENLDAEILGVITSEVIGKRFFEVDSSKPKDEVIKEILEQMKKRRKKKIIDWVKLGFEPHPRLYLIKR